MKLSHVAILATSALALFACGTSREVPRDEVRREYEVALRTYEADFKPSDFPPDIQSVLEDHQDTVGGSLTVPSGATPGESNEIVQGYRVQVFSTSDFAEAQVRQADAQSLFPGEGIYLVYEPPTYKIRVGDFLARFDAEQFMGEAIERGFANAWVVPEKVFKTPPARQPSVPQKKDDSGIE
jgi:hypothetical protein